MVSFCGSSRTTTEQMPFEIGWMMNGLSGSIVNTASSCVSTRSLCERANPNRQLSTPMLPITALFIASNQFLLNAIPNGGQVLALYGYGPFSSITRTADDYNGRISSLEKTLERADVAVMCRAA